MAMLYGSMIKARCDHQMSCQSISSFFRRFLLFLPCFSVCVSEIIVKLHTPLEKKDYCRLQSWPVPPEVVVSFPLSPARLLLTTNIHIFLFFTGFTWKPPVRLTRWASYQEQDPLFYFWPIAIPTPPGAAPLDLLCFWLGWAGLSSCRLPLHGTSITVPYRYPCLSDPRGFWVFLISQPHSTFLEAVLSPPHPADDSCVRWLALL